MSRRYSPYDYSRPETERGTREKSPSVMESEILGFGIRIPLTIGIRNPSSTDKEKGIHTWNLGSTAWNPESKTVLTCVADII